MLFSITWAVGILHGMDADVSIIGSNQARLPQESQDYQEGRAASRMRCMQDQDSTGAVSPAAAFRGRP